MNHHPEDNPRELTAEDRAIYEWQMWIDEIGEEGQRRLRSSSALVSRVGGLGGPVAQQLAAAGLGRIILAHGGALKPSDLNRQILMRHDGLGQPRVHQAARRLREFNPNVEIVAVEQNVSEENAAALVAQADIVFDCPPLFEERFLLNRECVRQGKPMIECAVFEMEAQVTAIIPGRTPCLACLYPERPPAWKRQFPVLGAVPALAAGIAVIEGVKLLTGHESSLVGKLLYCDTRTMNFMTIPIQRRTDCPICGGAHANA